MCAEADVNQAACLLARVNECEELSQCRDSGTRVLCAGMLLSSQFNVNYFAISEVDQWFTDFTDEYSNIGARATCSWAHMEREG